MNYTDRIVVLEYNLGAAEVGLDSRVEIQSQASLRNNCCCYAVSGAETKF